MTNFTYILERLSSRAKNALIMAQLVSEELKRRRWTNQQLNQRRKGDVEKIRIAQRLRAETTMTLEWIAQRLQLGSIGYVAHCLRQLHR